MFLNEVEVLKLSDVFLYLYSPKNYVNYLINMLFLYKEEYLDIFDFEFNEIENSFSYLVSFSNTTFRLVLIGISFI